MQEKKLEGFSGNIIPTVWYSTFKTAGKPDLVSITLLGEICFKYRVGEMQGLRWQAGYKYFEAKFGFSRNQVRDAFIRLEKQGVILREVLTQTRGCQTYGGVLYIKLNLQRLFSLQRKNFPYANKIPCPPMEKSELNNKNSNNYNLTEKDIEKLNCSSVKKLSREEWEKYIEEIQARYPKLLFPSKLCLIAYIQKAAGSLKGPTLLSSELPDLNSSCKEKDLENKMKHELFKSYGSKLYASWFSKLKIESFSTGICLISLPTKFMRKWVCEHYLEVILSCLKGIDALISEVRFLVGSQT